MAYVHMRPRGNVLEKCTRFDALEIISEFHITMPYIRKGTTKSFS
jgi:hypothetical protein